MKNSILRLCGLVFVLGTSILSCGSFAAASDSDLSPQQIAIAGAEAAEATDAAYADAEAVVRFVRYDVDAAELNMPLESRQLRLARLGSKVAVKETFRDDSPKPIETSIVWAGSPELRFTLDEVGGSGSYNLTAYGRNENFEVVASTRAVALLAPFQILDMRLADYLRSPNTRLVSSSRTDVNGRRAVTLHTRHFYDGEPVDYDIVFRTSDWALLGFTWNRNPEDPATPLKHYEITYRDGEHSPPVIQKLAVHHEDPTSGRPPRPATTFLVDSITFGETDPALFTLAGYGVETPAPPPAGAAVPKVPGGLSWSSVAVAFGLVTLGAALAAVAINRRRAA